MLSVVKLAPGQEAYYERSVAQGLDDYYAGRRESPGVWVGRGSLGLDLVGVVGAGDLGRLISGIDPATGERLREHAKARTITVERIDLQTGERQTEQRELRPVAGFDLVFGAPKSVSLLHALGDDDTRIAVSQAHESAWRAALAYLEDEACVTRRGKAGIVREQAGGFVAAAYQHRTSRAHDPHLHTQVIVANMARSLDGTWRALEGDAILRGYRLAAGYLCQAHLCAELSRSLGVEWHEPVKGMAEIDGIPQTVLDAFSTRRRQITDRLDETGGTSWRAAQVAAIETRERKEAIDLPLVREQWWERARALGFGEHELDAVLRRVPYLAPTKRELHDTAMALIGPDGLTAHAAVFTDAEIIQGWAEALARGADATQVRELAERITRLAGVEQLDAEQTPGVPGRHTTREIIGLERRALRIAEQGRDSGAPTVVTDPPDWLSHEQRRMVRHACETPDRVVCVVGLAGAGKTTASRAIGDALRANGIDVVGAAPSGVAAERLADGADIPSTTIHSLIERTSHAPLPQGCVVIVDEASMADTRSLTALLEQVDHACGKAILMGDPDQLPSVGAGGLFAEIAGRLGAAELRENRRQIDPIQHELLEAVRDGDPLDYLSHAVRTGRLVVAADPDDAKAALVADWWQHAEGDPAGNVMIALRRADVADLNTGAQELMERGNRRGPNRIVVDDTELAAGDRIICRRNDRAVGVRNGTRATILDVDERARAITVQTDRDDTLTLPRRYLDDGHVQLGYAMTGHSSQSLTVERAFVLAPDHGEQREWGYVTLSRARRATRIYVTEAALEVETHAPGQDRPDGLNRLARALAASAARPLAHTVDRDRSVGVEL